MNRDAEGPNATTVAKHHWFENIKLFPARHRLPVSAPASRIPNTISQPH